MKLGKLVCKIDEYTSASTVSIMLNNKVIGIYDRDDFYITFTSELENVRVSNHFLSYDEGTYIITLDINSFKAVFKI